MNTVLLALVAITPIAVGAVAAAFAMRYISVSAIEGMTRQPEIAPQLFTAMLIGMALVEALCIYTLVVTLVIASKISAYGRRREAVDLNPINQIDLVTMAVVAVIFLATYVALQTVFVLPVPGGHGERGGMFDTARADQDEAARLLESAER